MQTLPPFPDAEAVLCALFEQIAPTVTMTEADMEPPVIRVSRTGGSSSTLQDRPVCAVVCFGATRAEAWQMAQQCEQVAQAARGRTVAETVIDNARVSNPPIQPAYLNPDVRQVTTMFQFTWRRPKQ